MEVIISKSMKHSALKRFIVAFLICTCSLSVALAQTELKSFSFKMTKMSVLIGNNVGAVDKPMTQTIEVNLYGQCYMDCAVGAITSSDSFLLGELSGIWEINELNALEIKVGGDFFLVDKRKQVINFMNKGNLMIFSSPANPAAFQTEYNKLYALVSANCLKKSSASSQKSIGSATTRNNASSSSNVRAVVNETLPYSGSLSPSIFVAHPFGFVPSNCTTKQSIKDAIKKAGLWKDSENEIYKNIIYIYQAAPCLRFHTLCLEKMSQ